jgi:glutamate formiminotransferase
VLECVPNVAVGDPDHALLAAAGRSLLDLHGDADHQRAVLTLAGPDVADAAVAVRDVARALAATGSFVGYAGVHPCLGLLDVVPFVALAGSEPAAAVDEARAFARWAADELALPVFLYGGADPQARPLPAARRDAFWVRTPDYGPGAPHPSLGACAVGARPPLVAVNCWLGTGDRTIAPRVASVVRERDGGLAGVRALGLWLPGAGQAQVSMNVTDLERTGVEAACAAVRKSAGEEGATVTAVELVGLVPEAEYDRWSDEFRRWSGVGPDRTIEARLAGRP